MFVWFRAEWNLLSTRNTIECVCDFSRCDTKRSYSIPRESIKQIMKKIIKPHVKHETQSFGTDTPGAFWTVESAIKKVYETDNGEPILIN